MRNIPYDNELGLELPKELQLRRLKRVMECELTPLQKRIIYAYYFEERSMADIARRRGVHRSTVQRTLRRAEARLRRYLKY